jgi:hypothetical protein
MFPFQVVSESPIEFITSAPRKEKIDQVFLWRAPLRHFYAGLKTRRYKQGAPLGRNAATADLIRMFGAENIKPTARKTKFQICPPRIIEKF